MKQIYIPLLILLLALNSHAQWSGLDPSFGNNGYNHLSFPEESFGKAGVVTPDDKIIVVGEFELSSLDWRVGVARFLPDGALDNSFSSDGIDSLNVGSNSTIMDVALQPNGKIVVLGRTANYDHLVVRFMPDGGPDLSFGTNGFITLTGINGDLAVALSLQTDGKIVVAGRSAYNSSTNSRAFLFRLNTDGSVDNSFGTEGWVFEDIGLLQNESSTDVIAQDDGKIICSGYLTGVGVTDQFYLVRYNANGTLDNSFGSGGMVVDSIIGTGAHFYPSDLLQLDNNKYLVGGNLLLNDSSFTCVARFLPNGIIDNTFDSDGWQAMRVPGREFTSTTGIALRTDGSVLIGGEAENFGHSDFVIFVGHLSANGDIDHDYGGPTGLQTFNNDDFGSNLLLGLFDVLVQSNDKFVGVHYMNYGSPLARQFGVFRVEQLGESIGEVESPQLTISPNPVIDRFSIQISTEQNVIYDIELLDMQGRSVYLYGHRTIAADGFAETLEWPSEVPAGLYILRLGNGDWTAVTRLVKR